jgi:hypothetical protein
MYRTYVLICSVYCTYLLQYQDNVDVLDLMPAGPDLDISRPGQRYAATVAGDLDISRPRPTHDVSPT